MSVPVGVLLGSALAALADPLERVAGDSVAMSAAAAGESPRDTLARVRSVCERGAETLIVIDEASILEGGTVPADASYCLVSDHLNLSGANPLVGPNAAEWGPRFQDLTDAWDPALRSMLRDAGLTEGVEFGEGVVAGVIGRAHTAAEAAMLRVVGADLVSTGFVAEAISGRHAGRRIAGIAVVSEPAASDLDALCGLVAALLTSVTSGRR